MTFSEKMKELRRQTGKSQEQVSKEMGIAISTLRNYENGRFPDTYQLKIIKNYYNVSYDYLLEDDIVTKKINNVDIGKELGISDLVIKNIKYLKEQELQDSLNFLLENLTLIGLTRYISRIKLLEEQWICNICFLLRLYDFFEFFMENINKKTISDEITNLFELFNKKMYSFYNFIESNDYEIDIVSLDECIRFRDSLRKIQENFIAGNSNEFSSSIIQYTDICCLISDKMKVFIDFNKYSMQSVFNDFINAIAPNFIESDMLYFKSLKKYYKYAEYGFSENLIKQFEKQDKDSYLFNDVLYVKNIISKKEGVKNGSTRTNKK